MGVAFIRLETCLHKAVRMKGKTFMSKYRITKRMGLAGYQS